ncbi:hypothetical protein CRUP_014889, partial [Coryphaenoides rupestris]
MEVEVMEEQSYEVVEEVEVMEAVVEVMETVEEVEAMEAVVEVMETVEEVEAMEAVKQEKPTNTSYDAHTLVAFGGGASAVGGWGRSEQPARCLGVLRRVSVSGPSGGRAAANRGVCLECSVFIPSALYNIQEDVGDLLIPVRRRGDISQELLVVCYTQQATATGTTPTSVLSYSDYISRPDDHRSVVRFERGEAEAACRVVVIDDSLHEDEESFNVTLGTAVGGRLAANYPTARVTILPHADD